MDIIDQNTALKTLPKFYQKMVYINNMYSTIRFSILLKMICHHATVITRLTADDLSLSRCCYPG